MQVLHILFDESTDFERAVTLCTAGPGSGQFKPVAACLEGSALARQLAAAGVPMLLLPGVKSWHPGVWRRLNQARRTYNFSIVHTHDVLAAGLGLKCRQTWKGARWAHTWWTAPLFKRAKDADKFRAVDRLVVLNREAAKHLAAAGMELSRLRVIPGGIDPLVYQPRPAVAATSVKFAALGPLITDSGQDILVEALALFKAANPNLVWELRQAGEGPLFDDILRQAGVVDIVGSMALLGVQRPCNVLPQCDILVAPDVQGENGCEAVKQAWAAGLPVICSDLPVHAEMVRNGYSGRIVPRQDAAALADALSELWADLKLRNRLAQGGKESLKGYTLERMVEMYAGLYEELVTGARIEQADKQA
jgi:glycosyltransferase involved in cell wall biosynthesis